MSSYPQLPVAGDSVPAALPPSPRDALMPGAAVITRADGLAQIVDHETGTRNSIFASRELAERTRAFLGGKT